MFTIDEARDLLLKVGLFSDVDEDDPPSLKQTLNMNDIWCWACADSQYVPDDKLQELTGLFFLYGWAGVLFWVSEQNNGRRSEFHDNNRFIDFVRTEENLRKDIPNSSKRAYTKVMYTLGLPLTGEENEDYRSNEKSENERG